MERRELTDEELLPLATRLRDAANWRKMTGLTDWTAAAREAARYFAEQAATPQAIPKPRVKCCANCAEHGECLPSNERGCGYDPDDAANREDDEPATPQADASARGYVDDDRKRVVSSLQEMRDRLGGFLVGHYGDRFDGDIDTMLDAINILKAIKVEPATPQAASGDGTLPRGLVPWAKEWYRLCQHRYTAKRISISGALAEAIVATVRDLSDATPQAAQAPTALMHQMHGRAYRYAQVPAAVAAAYLAARDELEEVQRPAGGFATPVRMPHGDARVVAYREARTALRAAVEHAKLSAEAQPPLLPCPVCGGEAIAHRDKLAGISINFGPSSDPAPTEVLGTTCADGGKCHHHCNHTAERRCFRRECCSPLTGYTGPWAYPKAAEAQASEPDLGRATPTTINIGGLCVTLSTDGVVITVGSPESPQEADTPAPATGTPGTMWAKVRPSHAPPYAPPYPGHTPLSGY